MKKQKAKKLLHLFSLLKQLPSKKRIELLQYLDESCVQNIYEAVHNILHNQSIDQKQQKKLKKALQPYKTVLRYLGDKRKPEKQKRLKLTQIGGNPLALILSAAIPIISELLMRKIR